MKTRNIVMVLAAVGATSKGDADYQQILASLKKVVRRHEPGVKDVLATKRE
jgi:hypothetical protein